MIVRACVSTTKIRVVSESVIVISSLPEVGIAAAGNCTPVNRVRVAVNLSGNLSARPFIFLISGPHQVGEVRSTVNLLRRSGGATASFICRWTHIDAITSFFHYYAYPKFRFCEMTKWFWVIVVVTLAIRNAAGAAAARRREGPTPFFGEQYDLNFDGDSSTFTSLIIVLCTVLWYNLLWSAWFISIWDFWILVPLQ